MLVVEMVNVVGGTEGGGNSGGHSWAGEHQQSQRKHKPEQEGRTGPYRRWSRSRFGDQYQPSLNLDLHLLLHWGGAWYEQKAPPPHTTQTGREHLKWIQGPWSPVFRTGEEKKKKKEDNTVKCSVDLKKKKKRANKWKKKSLFKNPRQKLEREWEKKKKQKKQNPFWKNDPKKSTNSLVSISKSFWMDPWEPQQLPLLPAIIQQSKPFVWNLTFSV